LEQNPGAQNVELHECSLIIILIDQSVEMK